MQSYSGFASLPLPGRTNFEDDQELSLELGMRPCESLEPGLPCPALLRPALTCLARAMAHVALCCYVHCTACVAHFHARKQTSSLSGPHFEECFVCHACEYTCCACREARCECFLQVCH